MALNISYTIHAWCKAIGIQEKTLAIRLTKAGYQYEGREEIPAKHIIEAMCGDKERAQIEQIQARTESIRQKNLVKNGDLVELPAAERAIWESLLMPLRQEMELMPSKLAPLVNPENPKQAEKALFQFVEDLKSKLLKRKVGK